MSWLVCLIFGLRERCADKSTLLLLVCERNENMPLIYGGGGEGVLVDGNGPPLCETNFIIDSLTRSRQPKLFKMKNGKM